MCLQPTDEELEAQEAANQEAIRQQQEALQVDLGDPSQLAVHDQQVPRSDMPHDRSVAHM